MYDCWLLLAAVIAIRVLFIVCVHNVFVYVWYCCVCLRGLSSMHQK